MGNELLDYKKQANFDFFEFGGSMFSGHLSESSQMALKRDCERVLVTAHKTVRNFCELGVQLEKIHAEGRWRHVINPEDGMSFNYSSFEKFCEYAFGFSGTRTSNMLSLAKFLIEDENGGLKFIKERYEDFSTSQLIELAPVESWNRSYFTSDMTVAEMRLAKKYLKTDHCRVRRTVAKNFDLLQAAKEWEKYEEMCKNATPQPLPPADVIPGQIDLSGLEEVVEVYEFSETPQECAAPISDFEKARQDLELSNEAEGFVETFEEPSSDSEKYGEVEKTWRSDFKTRDGAREFLNDYRNWEDRSNYRNHFFEMVYVYQFRNGMLLWACERKIYNCPEIVFGSSETEVVYYLQAFRGDGQAEISKRQLERFFATYKDEL